MAAAESVSTGSGGTADSASAVSADDRDELSRCFVCRKILAASQGGGSRCSQCHMFEYCSVACQRVHWKSGGHKSECAHIAAARSQGSPTKRRRVVKTPDSGTVLKETVPNDVGAPTTVTGTLLAELA
jgi:hypothetical protein